MSVGQQEPVKPSKASTAAQQLALCALPTVYQDTLVAGFNENAGMVAFDRWHACRRPQKGQREHFLWPGSVTVLDVKPIRAPAAQDVLLALSSHGRLWNALPFKAPDASLPQILHHVGAKAGEASTSGMTYRGIDNSVT